MPIYEYKREDGTTFEIHQSMDEKKLEKCPETGQPCKRIISGGITTIKRGQGWPDKERKRKEWRQKNPGATTIDEYKKKIDKNTEKAKEFKAKNRSPNLTEI